MANKQLLPAPEGDDPKVPAASQALPYRLVGKGKKASIMAWAARILSLCVPIGRPVGVARACARGYGEGTGFSNFGGLRLDWTPPPSIILPLSISENLGIAIAIVQYST
jgi:hypothetical protein